MAGLHPLLPDTDLPRALRRPLRFGDPEQIQALNRIDQRIGDMIASADADPPTLRVFVVTVTVEGEYTETVLARNAAEASEKVESEFDAKDIDLDIHCVSREVVGRAKTCATPV